MPGTSVVLHLRDDVTLADRFRIARVAARMRPRDAARALGVSTKTYQRIESNIRPARSEEIELFADATGQELSFFATPPVRAAAA